MDSTVDELVKDGFDERRARRWIELLDKEKSSGMFDPDYLELAHGNGFLAESLCTYDLETYCMGDYLSEYDYYRLWPLNPWQRIWIDDKLTLKYMLDGTEFGYCMPDYYYYSSPARLLPLTDCPYGNSPRDFVSALKDFGTFACKPCNGARSEGFHKLEYRDRAFLIDDEEASERSVSSFPASYPNYVFTEFLIPEASMARIDSLISTLRVLVVNPDGANPFIAAGFLRFGVGESSAGGIANFTLNNSVEDRNYVTDVDTGTGAFGNGKLIYPTKVVDAPHHPKSQAEAAGAINCWEEVVDLALGIAKRFNALSYLGFDIGITPDGPRLMEINSHSGIHQLQVFRPFMANPRLAAFLWAHL